jgi:hypothetical protein
VAVDAGVLPLAETLAGEVTLGLECDDVAGPVAFFASDVAVGWAEPGVACETVFGALFEAELSVAETTCAARKTPAKTGSKSPLDFRPQDLKPLLC